MLLFWTLDCFTCLSDEFGSLWYREEGEKQSIPEFWNGSSSGGKQKFALQLDEAWRRYKRTRIRLPPCIALPISCSSTKLSRSPLFSPALLDIFASNTLSTRLVGNTIAGAPTYIEMEFNNNVILYWHDAIWYRTRWDAQSTQFDRN